MPALTHNICPLFLFLSFTLLSFGFCSPYARPTEVPASMNASSYQTIQHSNHSNASESVHGRGNSDRHCQPFYTTFSDPSTVADSNSNPSNSPFVALSPPETYAITSNGLEMYLQRPKGEVHSANGMNDNLGEAATINSTFWMDSGKVTYEASCDYVPGVVCAFILIDAVQVSDGELHLDEIDVELVGSGSARWQTNIFKPSKADPEPHYGQFDTKEQYPQNPSYTSFHKYSISWDSEKIVWGVDGQDARTIRKEDTYINGVPHFPGESDSLRLQLGIWDGSGAEGTSTWAGGPVNWDTAPQKIVATVRSVSVEC
ncbi:concanavalin A-like lectin/glucanase [Lentinula detonsa]|uniref:Concanavalin A-like lectin/glucanase n=1 Tax=Lentinula detonsa TaxID=2804962 RepID=A0AA38Q2I6_9AGAR|nr:concanavalin A-like lectin/glucanase [Lentinula detonsa]